MDIRDINEIYTEGLNMDIFNKIETVGYYSFEYYEGYDNNLLVKKTFNDGGSNWYVLIGLTCYLIGTTVDYCSTLNVQR